MPTRKINLTLEEQKQLAVLRSLAAQGFDQLDQGQGVVLNGSRQLARFVSQVGQRAAASGGCRKNDMKP